MTRQRSDTGGRTVAGLAAASLLLALACAPPGPPPPSAPLASDATPSAGSPSPGLGGTGQPAFLVPDFAGLVDIGTHALYLECYGTSGPVIVFDAGSGGTNSLWKLSPKGFLGLVDNRYRRCIYDRTNLGQSDTVAGPRTSATAAAELHALLLAADLAAPWILVGRSFGGYNVRLFAAAYPAEVTALVLIETLTPEFHAGFEQLVTPAQWEFEKSSLNATERPLDIIASSDLVAAASLPDVPLLVIAGTKWHSGNVPWPSELPGADLDALWHQAQIDLAASVPRGRLVVFEGGDHALQVSQPERLAKEINVFLAGV